MTQNVLIVTTIQIYKGNSAAASRLMNISRALVVKGVKVYLCSSVLRDNVNGKKFNELSRNIFLVGDSKQGRRRKLNRMLYRFFKFLYISRYIQRLIILANSLNGHKVFYLYPTGELVMDFIALLCIKKVNKFSLFYDANELRRAGLYNRVFSNNMLKKGYDIVSYFTDYIKFCIEEILTKYYDGLIVISTNLEKYFKKYNNNLLRIPILSNSKENPFHKPPAYSDRETFLICFAGMIILKKEGFNILYKALSVLKSNCKQFQLNLYGPICKEQKMLLLSDLPSKYGVKQNVVYHGVVDQSVLMEKLRTNHLLILPRPLNLQTKYGFSTKLSEYLVSGVPVLLTDVSDNSLYIKNGYNGFIVEPGDYKKMAEKIIYIITNYNDLKDIVSKNAYLTAEKYFNFHIYSDKLYNFLFGKGNIL